MRFSNLLRQHWAALRALLVLTVITGIAYPLVVWGIALLPGLHAKAEGSIVTASGKPVGSKLIGQSFTDKDGNPLPQYFQSRPSAAGAGYDPLASSASNLGPESVVDTPADPTKLAPGADPATAGRPSDSFGGHRTPRCARAGLSQGVHPGGWHAGRSLSDPRVARIRRRYWQFPPYRADAGRHNDLL